MKTEQELEQWLRAFIESDSQHNAGLVFLTDSVDFVALGGGTPKTVTALLYSTLKQDAKGVLWKCFLAAMEMLQKEQWLFNWSLMSQTKTKS